MTAPHDDGERGGLSPRGSFWLGFGLTLGAYALAFATLQLMPFPMYVAVAVVLIVFLGASMPQLGGSVPKYALGVATGLGVAFLVFAICAIFVITVLL